jgi:sodium/bile acid cotransporter 7
VAVLVTLLTNSTCFLITPLWLLLLIQTETSINVGEMITKLGLLVVTPMTIAQLLRLSPRIARDASAAKHRCGLLAQVGILGMVLIGAVTCGLHLTKTEWRQLTSPFALMTMTIIVVALHLAALWGGYAVARSLRLPRGDQLAVAFSGSQKTLMVGLYVAINYVGGLAILPMVVYHVAQLFVDTVIADRWSRQSASE